MQRPLQPQFKIRVYSKGVRPNGDENFMTRGGNYATKGNYNFMDIEDCVAWGVEYEEQASLLNTLKFTVNKHADTLLHRVYIGQWVVLYGGYYSDNGSGVRKVFSGTITRIRTSFPDNGRMSFSVECMSYGFTQMGKDTYRSYVYPDKNSTRSFAKGKEEISLEDLIKGLVNESGMLIGEIQLPKTSASVVFTKHNIRYQKNMSDWKFLIELANSYGCSIWTNTIDGTERLYFVDTSKATNTVSGDINFLYPLQGDDSIKDIQPDEIQRFDESMWNRPRILRNVTVDEDISMAYAVSRSAMYYDKTTGEYKEAISEIREDEGRKVITFYELDEAKVEYIHRTQPELADQIRAAGATSLPWSSGVADIEDEKPEYARYYYKAVHVVDETQAVFDRAFFGIMVTAVCNQDLDIRSQRSYNIRGIVRYSSSDKTGRYFLRGLKHIWDADGPITELDFIK